jgi:tetratricopeptide (TPR) repeat protein
MNARGLVALVVVAVFAIGAPAVHAQKEKRQAKKHLREGDKKFKRGDKLRDKGKEEEAIAAYEEAIAEYNAAYELFPSAKIYYPIAQAEERLGLEIEALQHYAKLLAEADELPDDFRADVELQIDAIKQRLVVLTFAVEPEGALIELDGKELGESPLAEPVTLIPGEFAIRVYKEGYKPHEETIEREPGESTVEVFLEKKAKTVVQVVEPDPEPKPEPKPTPEGRNRLIVGAAVTGGLAATAIVTGMMAQFKHSDFEDPTLSAAERESARDSGKTMALVTDLLWVGAIGAGAYTAYFYYTTYKPNQERMKRREAERTARRVWVSPYATDQTAGLAVGGSF